MKIYTATALESCIEARSHSVNGVMTLRNRRGFADGVRETGLWGLRVVGIASEPAERPAIPSLELKFGSESGRGLQDDSRHPIFQPPRGPLGGRPPDAGPIRSSIGQAWVRESGLTGAPAERPRRRLPRASLTHSPAKPAAHRRTVF